MFDQNFLSGFHIHPASLIVVYVPASRSSSGELAAGVVRGASAGFVAGMFGWTLLRYSDPSLFVSLHASRTGRHVLRV
jgi:hypothetical protein